MPQDDSPPPLRVDSFAHVPCLKEPLYVTPSLLERVRLDQLSVIVLLVLWYTEMICILAAQTWVVPQFIGALSQEGETQPVPLRNDTQRVKPDCLLVCK